MQNSGSSDDRNVVPRWRSLATTTSTELKSVVRFPDLVPANIDDFKDSVLRWRSEGTLANAVDLLDLGIFLNNADVKAEAVKFIRKHKTSATQRVLEAADRAVAKTVNLAERQRLMSKLEQNESYVRSTIKVLKRRTENFPRDVMAYVELARVYTTIGLYKQAEDRLRIALALAPNDRFVLRSMTQFYDIVGDISQALAPLWRSDSMRYDPWVQSAEVAAAGLSGRGSRTASAALRNIMGAKEVGTAQTELALGVATLELNSGAKQRKVFQLVSASIGHSTENALAQAVWLSDRTSRTFSSRFPAVELKSSAHEARSLDFFEKDQFEEAALEAGHWLVDQPFDARAAYTLMNLLSVQLNRPLDGLQTAERALRLHPADWNVLNAAMMIFARAEKSERARELAKSLERYAETDAAPAFISAGWGMVYFSDNQVETGRRYYEEAITSARKIHRYDLVLNASMFWAREESKHGLLPSTSVYSFVKEIDEAIIRVPFEHRSFLRGNWLRIRDLLLHDAVQNDPDTSVFTVGPDGLANLISDLGRSWLIPT